MSITLKQFNGASVTPKNDALLYDYLVGQNGIFEGCEITHLGGNQLQIAVGRGIICGRNFDVTQETILATVSDSGTKRGRLIAEVDIENTTTPIKFVTQLAATLPELVQEDINRDGTVFQLPLAEYDISTIAISNLESVAESIADIKRHQHNPSDITAGKLSLTPGSQSENILELYAIPGGTGSFLRIMDADGNFIAGFGTSGQLNLYILPEDTYALYVTHGKVGFAHEVRMAGTWDYPLSLDQGYLWVDPSGNLRIKKATSGRPTSATDGTVVGIQS